LQNAGLYIGWLERFLVITASAAIARDGRHDPDGKIHRPVSGIKIPAFAEYYLIGTLLSI